MPFIGKQPEVGAYSKLDAITASATTTYNLTLGGGAYYPTSANHLLVSLNGVMQAPQDSFTVSGSTIIFDSALTSSDSIDFIMALGDVLDIGTPSDGTVTSAKLGGALTTPSNLTVSGTLTSTGLITASAGIAIPSGQGIDFSAYANAAGMTSEILDDYEEGTFAPEYAISGGSVTTGTNAGRYVKIGEFVFFTFRLRTTAVSGTGTLSMTLPFSSGAENRSGGSRGYARDWGVDMPEFTIYTPPSSSVAVFYRHAMNVSNALSVTGSQMGTGSDDNVLEGSIVYRSA